MKSLIKSILIGIFIFNFIPQTYSQLFGTYTIGPTSVYKTFNQAVDALINQGFISTVIFNVEPGVYNEQLTIPDLFTSSTRQILFQSKNGDSASVILKFKPKKDSNNFTLQIDGASYIFFKGITITTDTTFGKVIIFQNGCTNIQFYNNRIMGLYKGNELVYCDNSASSLDNNIVFSQNHFLYGSTGIYMQGLPLYLETGNQIKDNIFTDQITNAIWLRYETMITVTGNLINNSLNDISFTGISCSEMEKFTISRNRIIMTDAFDNSTGIFLNYVNGPVTPGNQLVCNNFIHLNTTNFVYGIKVIGSNSDIVYNSINITGNYNTSTAFGIYAGAGIRLMNNVFANQAGGYAMIIVDTSGFVSDYNNLYSNGTDIASVSGTDYTVIDSFKKYALKEKHSVSIQPGYFSNNDLHTNSPVFNNNGIPLSFINTDMDKQTRSNTSPDIGADEHTGLFDIGIDRKLCGTDSIVLDAGAGFQTYSWTGGTTKQKLTVSKKYFGTGTFKVKVTATYNSLIFKDSLNVIIGDKPILNLGPDKNVCDSSFSWFLAPSGFKYLWSNGDTTQTIIIQATDTADYWVTITNTAGCKTTDTARVFPVPVPKVKFGKDTAICANQSISLDAGNSYDHYEWFDGSTNQTVTVDTNGRGIGSFYFWVIVINNGCQITDSIKVTFKICSSIDEITGLSFKIYPNPSSRNFNLSVNDQFLFSTFEISDLTGRVIKNGSISKTPYLIDLLDFKAGIYFLTLRKNDQVYKTKLVKID